MEKKKQKNKNRDQLAHLNKHTQFEASRWLLSISLQAHHLPLTFSAGLVEVEPPDIFKIPPFAEVFAVQMIEEI